jgi:hypothetical protein
MDLVIPLHVSEKSIQTHNLTLNGETNGIINRYSIRGRCEFGRRFYLRRYLCHEATKVVGDVVLIRRVKEGDGRSENGDGGHSLFFLA